MPPIALLDLAIWEPYIIDLIFSSPPKRLITSSAPSITGFSNSLAFLPNKLQFGGVGICSILGTRKERPVWYSTVESNFSTGTSFSLLLTLRSNVFELKGL